MSANLTGRWEVITADQAGQKSTIALKDKHICLWVLRKSTFSPKQSQWSMQVCVRWYVCVTESNRVAGIALQPGFSMGNKRIFIFAVLPNSFLSISLCPQTSAESVASTLTDRLSSSAVPVLDHYVIIFMDTVWWQRKKKSLLLFFLHVPILFFMDGGGFQERNEKRN